MPDDPAPDRPFSGANEYTNQLISLSSAAVVLIGGLSDGFTGQGWAQWLAISAVGCFVVCLLGCLAVKFTIARLVDAPSLRTDPEKKWEYDSLWKGAEFGTTTAGPFFGLALILLGIFVMVSLY